MAQEAAKTELSQRFAPRKASTIAPSAGLFALASTRRMRAALLEAKGGPAWTPFPKADTAEPPLPPLPAGLAPAQAAA